MNWPPPTNEPMRQHADTLRVWFRRYWWTLVIYGFIAVVAVTEWRMR